MNNERVPMEEQTGLMCETEPSDQPAEQRLSAPRTDSSATVLALIKQLALDPRADVAKLERVIALYERFTGKEAELAHNAAKGRILKKLAGIKIVKNRAVLSQIGNANPQKGTYEAFKYAPLRRSTNICARFWRKRRWTSLIPMNPASAAAS